MNTSGLLQVRLQNYVYSLYLHFIIIFNMEIIYSLGKTVLFLICNRINSYVGVYNGKAEQPE